MGDRAYFPSHVDSAAELAELSAAWPDAGGPDDGPGEEQADSAGPASTPRALETLVLQAFLAQHYLDLPPPPTLVLSHAVEPGLIGLLCEQSGVKIQAVHKPHRSRDRLQAP